MSAFSILVPILLIANYASIRSAPNVLAGCREEYVRVDNRLENAR